MALTQEQLLKALESTCNQTYNGVTVDHIKEEIAKLKSGEQVSIIGMIVKTALKDVKVELTFFD